MDKDGATRRQFLKTAGTVSLFALTHPLITSCSGSSGNSAPGYSQTITEMTAYIQKQLSDSGATGGVSIALVDDQTVVWVKSFGYADAAAGIPATPETAYRIGSVSKAFAATMIMQLFDQGLLDPGDPLTHFVPAFSIKAPLGFSAGGTITIRSILTHHSGIPGDMYNGSLTSAPDPNYITNLIACLQGEYLQYPTNFINAYSNVAVSLLGPVIENASGQSLQDYSDTHFQTLGMDHTSLSIDSPKVSANLAKGYAAGLVMPRYYANIGTSGAFVSTVQDMAKFVMMMNAGGLGERGRALRTDTTEMMLTPQNDGTALDFDSRIGFIWELTDPDLAYAGRLCWKDGAVSGFHCQVEILRDYKLGVVVCANDEQVPFMDIAKQALKLALRDKAGIMPPPPFVPPYSPPVSWDQARFDALQGVYVYDPENSTPPITVQSVAGAIEWTNATGITNHMVPRANGWLSTPASQTSQLEFSEVSGKKLIVLHMNGQSSLYTEYCIFPAISAAWRARVGTYQATNWTIWTAVVPVPSMTLVIQNGVLLLSALSQLCVLVPVSDTLAYAGGLGRVGGSAVQVLSVSPDGHEEIQLLGVRYRKS